MNKKLFTVLMVVQVLTIAAAVYILFFPARSVEPERVEQAVMAPPLAEFHPPTTPQPVSPENVPDWLRVPETREKPVERDGPEQLYEDYVAPVNFVYPEHFSELLTLEEKNISISHAALLFARKYHSEIDVVQFEAAVNDLSRQCSLGLERSMTVGERARALVRFVYGSDRYGISRQQPWFDTLLLEQKGDDLAMAVLVIALGQRLGLPWQAVTVPNGLWCHLPSRQEDLFLNASTGELYTSEQTALMRLQLTRNIARRAGHLRDIKTRSIVAEMYARLAREYLRLERKVEAREVAAAGLEFDSSQRSLIMVMGELLLHREPLRAVEMLQPLAANDEHNQELQLLLGRAFRLSGRPDAALPYLLKATVDESNPEAWRERASCRAELKQFGLAIADYQRVLTFFPDDAEVYHGLADAYTEWGLELRRENKVEDSLQAFTAALTHNPRHTRAYYYRAESYVMRGQRDLALADLAKLLEIEPNNEDAIELKKRFVR